MSNREVYRLHTQVTKQQSLQSLYEFGIEQEETKHSVSPTQPNICHKHVCAQTSVGQYMAKNQVLMKAILTGILRMAAYLYAATVRPLFEGISLSL